MDLHAYQLAMQPAIDAEMRRVVDARIFEPYTGLHSILAYHLGWEGNGNGESQGKRVRPLLVLLSAAACGAEWPCALPSAAAVELLHNFSLIHDDIEDRSDLRRGKKTVWARWGDALAINAGDAMFSLAHYAVLRLSETTTPDIALRSAKLLHETSFALTGGQHLDISYEREKEIPLDLYWPMVGGKTAALLSACAQLGAIAGKAEPAQEEAFRRFGYSLGLAFQVLDDWLGIWGDAARTGKSTESDLVAGKKTLPVLYALHQNGAFARRWRNGPVRPEEARDLAVLLTEEGAQAYTVQEADRLTKEALGALSEISRENDASKALQELAGLLLTRRQ